MIDAKLKFPYKIDNKEIVTEMQIKIENSEKIISFSLPLFLKMTIKNAKELKSYKENKYWIYLFEFNTIEDKEIWIEEDKSFYIQILDSNGKVDEIENEMNEFMNNYESKEKKQKRRAIVDEDGFMYYK